MTDSYAKIAQLKSPAALRARLAELRPGTAGGREDPDRRGTVALGRTAPDGHAPRGQSLVHPSDGRLGREPGRVALGTDPAALGEHRAQRGQTGVGRRGRGRPAGRAGPTRSRLLATPANRAGLAQLLARLRQAHRARFGGTDDLVVGLQLTHSGRFSRPHARQMEPRIAYHHPLLDAKFGIAPQDDSVVWTDAAIEQLIDSFVVSAGVAHDVGFQFVDVKACHGYLLHEFLSARVGQARSAATGRAHTGAARRSCNAFVREYPDLAIGVRLSVFDTVPYQRGPPAGNRCRTLQYLPYEYGFGLDADNPLEIDLREPVRLLRELHAVRRRGGQRDLRQPVLQSAHPATGAVSAE